MPTPNKFTDKTACRIRELYFYDGWTIAELSEKYSSHELTIRRILSGETYGGAGGPSTRHNGRGRVPKPRTKKKKSAARELATALAKCQKRAWSDIKIDQFKSPRWVVDAHLVPTFGDDPNDE